MRRDNTALRAHLHQETHRILARLDLCAERDDVPWPQLLVQERGQLRHRRLTAVMQERGWNQADLARFLGIPQTLCGDMLRCRLVPADPGVQQRLMALTGQAIPDLFPPVLVHTVTRQRFPAPLPPVRPRHWSTAWSDHAHSPEPEQSATRRELRQAIDATLAALAVKRPRVAAVLRAYFGLDGPEQTYAAIARTYGCSTENIRRLVLEGLRKLKHPSLSAHLRDFTASWQAARPFPPPRPTQPPEPPPPPAPEPPPRPRPTPEPAMTPITEEQRETLWPSTGPSRLRFLVHTPERVPPPTWEMSPYIPWPVHPGAAILHPTYHAWLIQRMLGPGRHSVGPEMLTFSEMGVAITDTRATVVQALLFPQMFRVRPYHGALRVEITDPAQAALWMKLIGTAIVWVRTVTPARMDDGTLYFLLDATGLTPDQRQRLCQAVARSGVASVDDVERALDGAGLAIPAAHCTVIIPTPIVTRRHPHG